MNHFYDGSEGSLWWLQIEFIGGNPLVGIGDGR